MTRTSARRWTAATAAVALLVVVPAASAAPAPATKLYARDAGTVCSEGGLDRSPGSGEGACFFVAQPVSDVSAAAGMPLHHEFTYGKPLARFAPFGRVGVRVSVGHVQNTAGAGVSIVDVTLLGELPDGTTATLGTASVTGVVSPTGTDDYDLSVPVLKAAQKRTVDQLVLRVEVRGAAAPHAYVRVNGRTWLDHAARP